MLIRKAIITVRIPFGSLPCFFLKGNLIKLRELCNQVHTQGLSISSIREMRSIRTHAAIHNVMPRSPHPCYPYTTHPNVSQKVLHEAHPLSCFAQRCLRPSWPVRTVRRSRFDYRAGAAPCPGCCSVAPGVNICKKLASLIQSTQLPSSHQPYSQLSDPRRVVTYITSSLLHPHLLLHLNHLHLLLIRHGPRNPDKQGAGAENPQPLPREPKTSFHPRSRVVNRGRNEAALGGRENILEGDDAVVQCFGGEVVVAS